MGPRPYGRGNAESTFRGATLQDLQWGRDRTVAEMWLVNTMVDRVGECLQWGRDRTVAEIRESPRKFYTPCSFNGAATVRSRKWPSDCYMPLLHHTFNGAATVR